MSNDTDWHDWHDRLDQADERLSEANTIIDSFIKSDPYGAVRKVHPRGNNKMTYTITLSAEKQIPRRLALLLAETFGHLRSSLDHLMCALCIATGTPEAPPGTQFPIFKDRDDFRAVDKKGNPKHGSGRWQMRGASPRVRATIQSLQPYKRGTDATSDPLWILHDFAVIDKHRKPHLTGSVMEGASLRFGTFYGVDFFVDHLGVDVGPFKPGTEICRVDFTITNPANYKMQMNADLTYGVAFDPKGPGRGQPVGSTVADLISHVRTVVVPKLEVFVK